MKEKNVFHATAEYAARLGIPACDVITSRGNIKAFYPDHRRVRRNLGVNYGDHIFVRTSKRQALDVKDTVAHELIHTAFPNVRHGNQMKSYIQGLQQGFLFFDGYRCKDGFKELIPKLVTQMPDKPVPTSKKLLGVQDHIKKLQTRIKRLNTQLRKWQRREKYYERRMKDAEA